MRSLRPPCGPGAVSPRTDEVTEAVTCWPEGLPVKRGLLGHVPVTDDRAKGLRLAFSAGLLAGALLGLELDESELHNPKLIQAMV